MTEIDTKAVYDYLGKIAYKHYGDAVGWVNYQGNPIPKWADLTDTIRHGWIMAGVGVAVECKWHIQDIVIDNERVANV